MPELVKSFSYVKVSAECAELYFSLIANPYISSNAASDHAPAASDCGTALLSSCIARSRYITRCSIKNPTASSHKLLPNYSKIV